MAEEYKIKEGMKEQLLQTLAEVEYGMLNDSDIINVLIEGCEGWRNMPDRELIYHCEDKETFLEVEKEIINWKRSIKNSYNEWTWLDLAEEIQSMVSREDIEELIYFLKQVQLSSASSSELIKEK
jgi:hypothetical protein